MILRGSAGRVRAGWRLGLFILAFLAFLFVLGQLATWLNAPWATGMWPERWTILMPLAAALAASWLLMERLEGRPLAALGLPVDRLVPGAMARGTLVGVLLIAGAVLVMVAIGALAWKATPTGAWRAIGVLLELSAFLAAAALTEELLLRGYPFQLVAEVAGGMAAVVLMAVVFAALHALNPHVSGRGLLNIGLAGLLLGAAFWRTMNLWFVTGIHFGWNWAMGVGADLPVSGLDGSVPGFALDTPGFDAIVTGRGSLTGGAFGPEGGWIVTGVTLAGLVWVMATGRLRPSLRVLALRPPAVRRRARAVSGSGDRPEGREPMVGGARSEGEIRAPGSGRAINERS
ncbi:MAG: CPBP family intramembrane metalloprotease [Gemmatimonadota bacterium]|nr:MAG: CPBP family intramembrane metalloprotease [Gemmatimonadota bacterium]